MSLFVHWHVCGLWAYDPAVVRTDFSREIVSQTKRHGYSLALRKLITGDTN